MVTTTVRRYLRQERLVPSGFMNALEFVVLYVRDAIVEPNVGRKCGQRLRAAAAHLGLVHPVGEC